MGCGGTHFSLQADDLLGDLRSDGIANAGTNDDRRLNGLTNTHAIGTGSEPTEEADRRGPTEGADGGARRAASGRTAMRKKVSDWRTRCSTFGRSSVGGRTCDTRTRLLTDAPGTRSANMHTPTPTRLIGHAIALAQRTRARANAANGGASAGGYEGRALAAVR